MSKDFVYEGNELELFSDAVNWKSYFSNKIMPFISGHVLEVGAGIGNNTKILETKNVISWTCLEPDKEMTTQIENLNMEFTYPLSILNGTIASISNSEISKKFDTILYIDVLEHIKEDDEELEAAQKLLTTKGRIIVLSPAHNFLFSPFDRSIGHYRRYNKRILNNICPKKMKGSMFYLDSVGLIASSVNRYLLKQSMPTKSQIKFWDTLMITLSKIIDPLTFYKLGKTIVSIYRTK